MAVNLLEAAVGLVLGVYLSSKFSADFLMLFFISYILIWAVKTILKHICNISSLVVVIVFVAGAFTCKLYSSIDMHECSAYIDRYVTVTGRISELPVHYDDNTQYVLNVKYIRHGDNEAEVNERVLVTSDKDFEYNDTVEFTGFLKEFPEKLNQSSFDILRYYTSKGIFFKMYSENGMIADEEIKDYSVYAVSLGFKNSISQFIDKYNTGDKAAVLKAVLIGNKKELSDELYDVLIRTSTSRCLYPAYLHVMLITAVIGLTAGFIGKKYRDWALIALLILYAVINSYRPVFLRVTILSILMIFWKRRYGYAVFSDMMSLTIMIIGFSNPLILFDGGFVISVCASALIRYFYKPVYGMLSGNAYVRNGLTMGLIFTIGTLPLGAYFFGGVSLYSVIATIIFIPPVLGIILSFPIVFVLTSIFGCAPLASGFMTVMTYIIMYVPRLMDKLISSYIILPRPSLVFIAAYALAVAAAGFYIHKKKKYFSYALFVSAALFSSVIASQITRLNTVEITFVNVGQGDGAIIDVPYRGSILIDGGGGSEYSTYNIGEKVFVPYLETQGIVKIEAAFVSHYHKDHIEGIIAAIENLRVRNVFMPDVMPENKYRKAIEEAAAANNTKIYYISEDTRVLFDNGLTVSITVPTAKTALISDDENDTSLLYNVEYGEFSCLFTGDMSSFAERNLAAENKAFDCDVLKVAHHGSDTSTSTEWLEAVSPEYAVISVGENNAYDLPDEDVLERLDGIMVLRTDKNGDIKITADMRGIKRVDSYRR